MPQQTRFKLAIVDGFAGGGRYRNGEPGSPIVFVETLVELSNEISIFRAAQGMAPLESGLNEHLGRHKNATGPVGLSTLNDILRTFRTSGEIFLTFMIKSLLAFLQKSDPQALQTRLHHLDISANDLAPLDGLLSKNEWLGTAEKIVFDAFQGCAPFVSTFSLNNPEGWQYWLIHFSNVPRARQVYNDVLHDNSNHQAHYGRSGLSLNMFAFDPDKEGKIYMFEQGDRKNATNELAEDIPRLVEEFGDAMEVKEFYESAYNLTPAHSDDIKAAMFLNPDLEVLTPSGNVRRKSHTISEGDTLRLMRQKSFHILWGSND